jgi:hypothetical protein
MMNKLLLIPFCIGILILSSCESKDPSILKVYVRTLSNGLLGNARVVVIGDQQSNPATMEFVDTIYTNSSGFITINMDQYFDEFPNSTKNTTGYFDLIVEKDTTSGTGQAKCKIHTTTVETVYVQ